MRLTCAGWYATPNSRLITFATREQVHRLPRKPKLSAPRLSKPGISCRASVLKRRGAPGDLRFPSAAGPPSLPALIHWLTAPLVTPRASAISFCRQPAWKSAQARLRRSSFQLFGCFFSMWPMKPQLSDFRKGQCLHSSLRALSAGSDLLTTFGLILDPKNSPTLGQAQSPGVQGGSKFRKPAS